MLLLYFLSFLYFFQNLLFKVGKYKQGLKIFNRKKKQQPQIKICTLSVPTKCFTHTMATLPPYLIRSTVHSSTIMQSASFCMDCMRSYNTNWSVSRALSNACEGLGMILGWRHYCLFFIGSDWGRVFGPPFLVSIKCVI